jgi:hypothetical protein
MAVARVGGLSFEEMTDELSRHLFTALYQFSPSIFTPLDIT